MISTSVTDRTSVTAGLAMGSRKIGSDMFAAVFAKTSVERRRFCLRSMCRMVAMRPREFGHREAYARSSASVSEKQPTDRPCMRPPKLETVRAIAAKSQNRGESGGMRAWVWSYGSSLVIRASCNSPGG